MSRPIPIPVRRALIRLWEQGIPSPRIADSLGLPHSTVRRLILRFRRRGADGLEMDYRHALSIDAAPDPIKAALQLRREHPTWGAGLIRTLLKQESPEEAIPTERTLQRWFVRAELAPAPPGRRSRAHADRATAPHDTWQMDAKDLIQIRTGDHVSWLRIVDEFSGTVLRTVVFPPSGEMEPGPQLGRP